MLTVTFCEVATVTVGGVTPILNPNAVPEMAIGCEVDGL